MKEKYFIEKAKKGQKKPTMVSSAKKKQTLKNKPERENYIVKLDKRVIELIKKHYKKPGSKIAEHIEMAILNDLGIALPPPEKKS